MGSGLDLGDTGPGSGDGRGRDEVIIAPGFQLLSKIIRVPVVEPSRQVQTVAYEVQQNML